MGKAPWCMFPGTRCYHLGSSGAISIAPVSRKPTLPSWQRWGKLHGACFQEPDVTILVAVEETRSRLLLENPRYHLGSGGESSMVHVSRNPTLTSWQQRSNLDRACFYRKPTLPSRQRWRKLHGGISRNPTLPSW